MLYKYKESFGNNDTSCPAWYLVPSCNSTSSVKRNFLGSNLGVVLSAVTSVKVSGGYIILVAASKVNSLPMSGVNTFPCISTGPAVGCNLTLLSPVPISFLLCPSSSLIRKATLPLAAKPCPAVAKVLLSKDCPPGALPCNKAEAKGNNVRATLSSLLNIGCDTDSIGLVIVGGTF